MAACQGGRLVVHFTNRKNAPLLFFHTNGDTTVLLVGAVCLFSWAATASAQVYVPALPRNLVVPTVQASVVFDSASGLYTYQYQVSNAASSPQEIAFFSTQFAGQIISIASPAGWMGSTVTGRSVVTWGAVEGGEPPPDYVDDGNLIPSPFQIKPGQTLGGFTFTSPDPPSTSRYYAEDFAKLPHAEDVGELEGQLDNLDFKVNSVVGDTVAPLPIDPAAMYLGGRRPSVDTFLVFLNVTNGATLQAPLAIVIKFGPNGEQVNRSTFRATLNRIDVTAAFQPGGAPGDLVAIFSLGASPLQTGRNVLITTVDGIVPGTTHTASDVDRLTFDANP